MRSAERHHRASGITGLFPAEKGRLHIDGMTFRTEDEQLWQWRGFSCFLLFLRYCRGEDIRPTLQWLRDFGYNIPRIFGPLPWAETPDYRAEHFRFDLLDGFLTLLESYGLRSNWSLAHYRGPDWRTFAQRFYDIAKNHWSVVVEAVNEPDVHAKPDPIEDVLKGVNRYGIPTAYGYYAKFYDSQPGLDPTLDFATIHIQRDAGWHRKARHAQEWQQQIGKPVISDEPAKLTEPGFHYPGGKNDGKEFLLNGQPNPNYTPAGMVWHAAICCLWTPGCTVHTEEGKWGRVPTLGMLQHLDCEFVRDHVWLKIDASWQTGKYNGSHMSSTTPVNFIPDVWTYSSLHAHRALSVRCYPSAPQPRNGWFVQHRWGPSNSLLTLTK